ncbi:hypothetical protein [Marivirga lumbricoides]|uniref:hypothetical protein n=1 Tax=Marivirga lumbricoides TaxID=1046115 RepID=UPI003CD05C2A
MAKATAGEIDSQFISVGIDDILDMYIGQSEKKLNMILCGLPIHCSWMKPLPFIPRKY